jgi:hypothetical protein
MAAREAAKEREENARKRKKTKNSTTYTIPIMDYKDLRNKFVYIKAKTSNDDCWPEEQELTTKVCPMRALDFEKLG